MSTVILPLPIEYQRQQAQPIDVDTVFSTTAARTAYLTNPRRYAGMIVGDTQAGSAYMLNAARSAWVNLAGTPGTSQGVSVESGNVVLGQLSGALGDPALITGAGREIPIDAGLNILLSGRNADINKVSVIAAGELTLVGDIAGSLPADFIMSNYDNAIPPFEISGSISSSSWYQRWGTAGAGTVSFFTSGRLRVGTGTDDGANLQVNGTYSGYGAAVITVANNFSDVFKATGTRVGFMRMLVNNTTTDVAASAGFSATNDSAHTIDIELGASTHTSLPDTAMVRSNGAGGLLITNDNGGDIAFSNQVAFSSTHFARFKNSTGNFLIGTTSDTARLCVVNSLTGSSAVSTVSVTPTWNTSGNPTAVFVNVTNTASGTTALIADIQVGGTSLIKVTKSGAIGVTVGSAAPLTQLHLNDGGGAFNASLPTLGPLTITGTNTAFMTIIGANNTPATQPGIVVMRARGTLASPTTVVVGDWVASFIAASYDGTSRLTAAGLEFFVDAAVTTGSAPTRACLSTGTYGGDRLPHLAVDYQGHVGIGQNMTSAAVSAWLHIVTGSSGAAGRAPIKLTAGTLLTSPELGTIEYSDNGTTGHMYATVNVGGVVTRVQFA